MITLVIADDEKLIRAGIRKILADHLGDSVRIFEAKNGKEAYDLCVAEDADVVITDIRMPIMDGVELMKNLSSMERKPAIIILSGFDDFAYAKAAISSGALAYLLKPIDTKELIAAVNTALTVVQKNEKQKNEQALHTIMSEGYSDNNINFDSQKFPNGFCCVGIAGRKCSEKIFSILSQDTYYVIQQKKDFLNILISREAMYLLKSDLGISNFVVGISSPSEKISELRRLRREAVSAMFQSFFTQNDSEQKYLTKAKENGVYYYTWENQISDFSMLDARYDRIMASIDLFNSQDVKKNLLILFDFDSIENSKRAECVRYIYSKIINNLFRRYPKISDTDSYLYLKSVMIENIQGVECLSEWIHYVTDYILYLVELLKQSQDKYPYITRAISFIDKHYAEDITMASVANSVSMNYTWFSEKFKEQMGVNFNDYLRRYRMEKAKAFLESGTFKVFEVAQKTGFKDVKHFMKCFKEMYGMTAGEWIKTHAN